MAAKSSGSADLREVLVDWILERVFLSDASLIRSEAAFAERLEQGKPGLITMANEACAQLVQVLDLYHQLRKSLSHVSQVNWMAAVSDLKQQLDRLVYQGFLNGMTPQRFADYQRYLKAMQLRLDKLAHAAPRDRQLMREMEDCYQRWLERQQAIENKGKVDIRLEEIRWMLEELRISLFAQQVKTAYPVSVKRINKRWNELGL